MNAAIVMRTFLITKIFTMKISGSFLKEKGRYEAEIHN